MLNNSNRITSQLSQKVFHLHHLYSTTGDGMLSQILESDGFIFFKGRLFKT